MRPIVLLFSLLLLFSSFASAHEEDGGAQSCSAPVLSEATIPLWQFAALVALFVAGAVAVGFGLSFRKHPLAAAGILMVLIAAGIYASGPGFNFKTGFFEKNQHVHADVKVYIQGQAVNFSEYRFQSTNQRPLTEFIHLHDDRGSILHLHASGVPLSYLFGTFGGNLNASCIQVASGEPAYCTDDRNSLRFYVNGNWYSDAGGYVFSDLDQLLISYGPPTEDVKALLSSVTAESCILSGKCPVPPGYDLHKESCAS